MAYTIHGKDPAGSGHYTVYGTSYDLVEATSLAMEIDGYVTDADSVIVADYRKDRWLV